MTCPHPPCLKRPLVGVLAYRRRQRPAISNSQLVDLLIDAISDDGLRALAMQRGVLPLPRLARRLRRRAGR